VIVSIFVFRCRFSGVMGGGLRQKSGRFRAEGEGRGRGPTSRWAAGWEGDDHAAFSMGRCGKFFGRGRCTGPDL